MLLAYFRLLRPEQWIKNLLIFVPAFFAGKLLFEANFLAILPGFVSFCLISSSVYIFNDLHDVASDKLHPEKKHRAIASGAVSPNFAKLTGLSLMLLALFSAWMIGLNVFVIISGYLVLNILYTHVLKHVAILDLSLISLGFLLRIYAGGVLADVPISKWLFLMVFLLSFFIGLAKRRDDLLILEKSGKSMRHALKGYSKQYIDYAMVFLSSVIVLSYIMYTLSDEVQSRIGSDQLYWSSVFVVLGILRYMQLTWVFEKSASPVKTFLTDKVLLLLIIAWLLFFGYCLYL